ncbi:uncharacterized protein [Euphorbia lathyris]|uniref:uncharacterized protein isoform X2 n=1 Tax=Euphorbia lathyris TaxID=212925 RepID=UPI00331311B9
MGSYPPSPSSLDSFSLPPTKRLKTLNPNSKRESSEYELAEKQEGVENDSRGKQPILTDDSDSLPCGICLSENGNEIRGQIDSCDHFFCFVCIMEWAKVESRCPMCKRRFTTIRRPPKEGVFPSERIVNVLQRDQDANQDLCVKSNEVKTAESDALSDVPISNQNILDISNVTPVDREDVSIFDIVCNSGEPVLARLRARSSSFPHERQPNRSEEMNLPGEGTQTSRRRTPQSNSEKINQNGARTLSRCRDVCNYVQAVRDNWTTLQNGSLRFSSIATASSRLNIGNCSSVPANGGKVTKDDSLHGTSVHGRCPYDIDKAWKMLDKAKSVKQDYRRTNGVDCVLKNPPYKGSASKTGTDGSSSLHSSKRQLLASRGLRNSSMTEKQYTFPSLGKETDDKHISTKWRMQKHSLNMPKAMAGSYDNRPNPSPGFSASASASRSLSTSSQKNQTSSERNATRETQAQKRLYNGSQNVTNKQDGSGSSVTSVMSVAEASESLNIKADLSSSSSCRAGVSKEDVKLETGCTGSKAGKYEDAKSEIQLLVKLNLKLLNGAKQLGINGFKEVARVVTHTILAACGFKESRHVIQSVPSCVCSHSDGIQQLHKSTLMPNSCRECFYVFVKDVVNSVLSEKLSKARAHD